MTKERQLLHAWLCITPHIVDPMYEKICKTTKELLAQPEPEPLSDDGKPKLEKLDEEVYQYYDEDDKFIGEFTRNILKTSMSSYPIDDGNGIYFTDKKGLCVLSSRVAVWTLRHYSQLYFGETK